MCEVRRGGKEKVQKKIHGARRKERQEEKK